MAKTDTAFETYISEINKAYSRGDATEHTHRPALKNLIESLENNITATNEPKRKTDCGAPDMLVSRQRRNVEQKIGFIECKDIGLNLNDIEKSEQIKDRYLPSFDNFILTDYIEFRLYINREKKLSEKLAEETGGKFKITQDGIEKVSQLLNIFLSHEPIKIGSAKELTVKMGGIAKLLRDIINNTLEQELETGTLHSQYGAFKEVLIHDLTEEQFADMYSQTICYGLFSARCHLDDVTLLGKDNYAAFHGMDGKDNKFTRETAANLLPKTNPFLRKTFYHIAGPDLDDRISWLVDELVELLQPKNTDISSVLRDFAKKVNRKDPVFHFYETFLAEFDKKLKKSRGVYYTPDEVVSYIVRSVDILLKEKFGLQQGFADKSKITIEIGKDKEKEKKEVHRCLILDPAVGTGTFLYEVIEQIYSKFKRQKGSWSSYVKEHLLPRIFGFELMMAPYAICHMKLGLQLANTDYDFKDDERLGVYLTNTLEEAEEKSNTFWAQWISEEARAANKVKKDFPIMVVLGNPPYAGHSANASERIEFIEPFKEYSFQKEDGSIVHKKASKKGAKIKHKTFIGKLIQDYYQVDGKPLGEKNSKWLQDDYAKFIRFGQWRIEQTGAGILAFITNHSYLDSPTFRGMRQQLMNTFSDIYVLDLHGNSKKKETCPDGSKDVNVFDIQQGVSIAIFVKTPGINSLAKIHHADLYGLRKDKYDWLLENDIKKTNWQELNPQKPFYLFTPQNTKLLSVFDDYWKITDVMSLNVLGFQTHRDQLVIDFDRSILYNRICELRNKTLTSEDLISKYNIKESKTWNVNQVRERLCNDKKWESKLIDCLYRPFDKRVCYFSEVLMDRPRRELQDHVVGKENICLLISRQLAFGDWQHILATNQVAESCVVSLNTREGNYNFPLYRYPIEKKGLFEHTDWPAGEDGRIPNLDKRFVDKFAEKIDLKFVSDGCGDLKKDFGPEDVLAYIYGIFHSPEYRKRYAEFLKRDFPRVPIPPDKDMFVKICKIGQELIKLHLLEAKILEDEKQWPKFNIKGSGIVEKGYPKYVEKDDKGRVYINQEQYFEGVEPEVWEFYIGGYQVCEKWLKDRRERPLSYDDQNHYQKIVVALRETGRLMKEKCLFEFFGK